MKFEYLDVTEPVHHGAQQELLNKLGAEGWELVYYNPDTRAFHAVATVHAVFKRDIHAWTKQQEDIAAAAAYVKKSGSRQVVR